MVTRSADHFRCWSATDVAALYDFVIESVVMSVGDKPIRLDRVSGPGDIDNPAGSRASV
jgi:hypothetical protein